MLAAGVHFKRRVVAGHRARGLSDGPVDAATLLGELDLGNEKPVAELVVSLYSELRHLASRYLRRERSDHTLQTTALVHEAYLRLAGQREVRWKTRSSSWASLHS